jgi:hypothetical protein
MDIPETRSQQRRGYVARRRRSGRRPCSWWFGARLGTGLLWCHACRAALSVGACCATASTSVSFTCQRGWRQWLRTKASIQEKQACAALTASMPGGRSSVEQAIRSIEANLYMYVYERTCNSPLQHGAAQCSAAQHSRALHNTAQHSAAQHSATQRSTPHHSTAHHSTIQHSTAQCSTAQHSAAQLSTAPYTTARHSAVQFEHQ